jgi:chromosome segregation ATPase
MRAITIFAAAAVAAAGCASGPPTVLDADYGRLRPDQAGSVDGARSELARAHAELEAAKAGRTEASRELQAAAREQETATRELDRAKKRVEAAEARVEYAEQLGEARKAAEEAARQRVELSKQYDDKAFYGRVADAQKRLDDAQDRVKKLEQGASDGKRRWEDLARKVPASIE